ncbi:hypothetical protein LZY01_14050 [Levilactobacillus zymae]|uniref:Uncharacterized protein n=1 Tax=Levilactobacillus zymae TaxID=267363 RepID=A0ABQ0X1E3_9LACO|nr:hypothetical protein [Levilactobacillus zymae]KRL06866.1 hypothetical protein FD38_GL000735 [Levilactobacillus zymae DSM 19395]QFR61742.1 hypothetical protein LZ395_09495 [Levilactobacillus zymae]GEO72237.1 hypothetical protein LZY01_14050 [Levilactobacillus zymae]
MKRLKKFLNTPVRVSPDFHRLTNYLVVYCLGLPGYLVLIVLNCRFIRGTFIFNWDWTSWYVTVCYLLLPVERIFSAVLSRSGRAPAAVRRHAPTDQPDTVARTSTLLRQLPLNLRLLGPGDVPLIRLVLLVLGLIFTPFVLLGMLLLYGWRKRL